MASATFAISCTTAATTPTSNSSHLHKPSKFLLNPNLPKHRRSKLSCAASSSKGQNPSPENITRPGTTLDRRNVLLGLSGLYGAYNLSLPGGGALASPVPAPDITKCGPATITSSTEKVPYSCCPPFSGTIVDYKLPEFTKLNVRPAAHAIHEDQLEKYKTAVQRMKELPEDDPRNFYQQANVHCAYCNGAYKLAGGQEYQVHFSWLFFPFHRWYLYFHERILQSLIGDPTFTLPYWNWDNPQGMFLPEIFDDKASPLYNEVRDQRHHKDLIVDLAYSAGEALNTTELQILRNNLAIMYRQMVTNAPCPALFFGNTLRGEGYDTKSGGGTIENVPHNTLHRWVGDPTMTNNEDMGNFYSAAKDPVFYCHHGNVDRMWSVWKGLGGKRRDIADPDWLQSEFLFYDENKNLVKVKVQDCLDHKKLGYTFQDMPTQWMRSRPTSKKKTQSARSTKISIPLAINILPTTLQQTVTFYVMRPKTSRSKQEKADMEELLNLNLTYDETKYIRFDVFLNEDNLLKVFELDRAEYLGSFANLAHIHENSNENQPKTTTYSLAITELLEDLGLELDKNVAVTVVPKYNGEFMTINSTDVSLLSC